MPEPPRTPDRFPVEFLDFSGGLNEQPPTKLALNELHKLENWFPFGKILRRRGGVQFITQVPAPVPINSVLTYVEIDRSKPTNQLDFEQATFVAGADQSVLVYDPIAKWRTLDSAAIGLSTEPWITRQYNNAIYMCRRGSGLRVTRPPFRTLYAAGIPQPVTNNFTLTQMDNGPLFAGTYEYVITHRNSQTRAESGRSRAQRIQLSADAKFVKLASLVQPPAGSQANEIRIWRSLRVEGTPPEDEFDEYYYLATVPAGTSIYEDRKEQIELGALLGTRNDIPPGNVHLFEIWEERAWLSDGREVIWSEVAQPESYYFRNRMLCGPDDGSIVTALVGWGNRLMMPKTEVMYYMMHTGPNEFSREVFSDRHGCWAPHSMRAFETILLWFGGDSFYRSDGGPPYSITSDKLERTLARLPFDRRHEVYAAVYPRHSWYLASIPQRDQFGAEWRVIMGYNYKTNAWFTFRHFDPDLATVPLTEEQKYLHWIREVPGGNLDDGLLTVSRDGHIYQYDRGNVDRPGPVGGGPQTTIPIRCVLRTPAIPIPKSDSRYWLRRFRLLCDTVYGTLRAFVLRDEVSYDKERLMPVNAAGSQGGRWLPRRWKLYNLNSVMLGATNQLELEHVGRDEVRLEGVAVESTVRPEYDQRAV
jgi:hypothetical protein